MFKILTKIALMTVVVTTLGFGVIGTSSADEDIPEPTKPSCSEGCHPAPKRPCNGVCPHR
ncbi:hypothetical protein [Moorena sp. SIO3A2]|uniref:hypothetical protein n=1 Tax=Moorena sp. SIO3A2 TaxID=2607841 RepID=UPI0013BCA6C3|nr:hypothetical protein [Moorena sp. SIO3A2]NER89930.1 hypothetical protein [Moorena sp. SIO3A2]